MPLTPAELAEVPGDLLFGEVTRRERAADAARRAELAEKLREAPLGELRAELRAELARRGPPGLDVRPAEPPDLAKVQP